MASKSKAGSTAATAAGVIGSSAGGGSGGISGGINAADPRKANKPSAALLEAKRRARNMLKNQSNAMQECVTDIFQNVSRSR